MCIVVGLCAAIVPITGGLLYCPGYSRPGVVLSMSTGSMEGLQGCASHLRTSVSSSVLSPAEVVDCSESPLCPPPSSGSYTVLHANHSPCDTSSSRRSSLYASGHKTGLLQNREGIPFNVIGQQRVVDLRTSNTGHLLQ